MASKKKPRKQKPKTLKQQPSGLPTYEIKISEAILKLSDSLRKKYTELHRLQGIIVMTVMAWNISLFTKEEQVNVQKMLLDALPEQLSAEDVSLLLENIDILIERKNQDYPHIREYILEYHVSVSGEMITLTVGTAPVPNIIQRRVSAG
jgi:hypothetical protein